MEPAGAGARDEEDLVDGGIGDVDGLDDVGADELRSDVDLLLRVWQNEKCAPEILPYEATLVERVREQIQLMEENIEAFATEIKDDLMLSLYRMDVNRTLFLLRSYLRARLHKIERFPIHIVDNPELWDRLSEHEQEYTNKYCEILAKHFEKTVLIRLPDQYGSMLKQTSLASEENDMNFPRLTENRAENPNGSKTFVFFSQRKCLRELPLIIVAGTLGHQKA
ncbi:hypothetical protein AXG93_1543s1480 [Marchantia polymorpha subsp. ruderalis]|uniref:GINS subunit domain-containing protein n=1 Tax=Marchantia polymorpha subsp. ruderalis TaxID=1480154 RepID=A0A176VYT1_MARPO|nr:hypothetical protein AXG93_1543s1480 [Marchantia polymorpha subsp. ruderalis]